MGPDTPSLSCDGLILAEIEGKGQAVSAYDQLIWKVRAGYSAFLYGTFTLVAGFGDKGAWAIPVGAAAVTAAILIVSFSVVAFLLDYRLSESKMKVVEAKEELVDLATDLALDRRRPEAEVDRIKRLLHNSGEAQARVDWQIRPSRWPFWMLYVGTGTVLCLATLILATQAKSALPAAG